MVCVNMLTFRLYVVTGCLRLTNLLLSFDRHHCYCTCVNGALLAVYHHPLTFFIEIISIVACPHPSFHCLCFSLFLIVLVIAVICHSLMCFDSYNESEDTTHSSDIILQNSAGITGRALPNPEPTLPKPQPTRRSSRCRTVSRRLLFNSVV